MACAYYLAAEGARVTVWDRGDIGGGTSSRCDGNVLAIDKEPGYDGLLALHSQEVLHDLAGHLGPMEYRRPGSYLAAADADEAEAARDWVDRQNAAGIPMRFLNAGDVRRELPDLAPDIEAGVYCPSDSTLNPLLYVQRLAAAARELGADLRPRQGVRGLAVGDGGVTGVELDDGAVMAADVVVVAAGVWTPDVVRPVGVDLPIRPRKGQLVVSAEGPRFGRVKVMEFGYLMSKFGRARRAPEDVERYGVALVYEPTAAGNFLLGSSREFRGFDTVPDPAVNAAIIRRALRFYPEMAAATMIRSYAGLRPWTPDHLPIVSSVPTVPGLFVAAGHEGDGIGLAAATGEMMAALVLDRRPALDPGPLRADRPGLREPEAGVATADAAGQGEGGPDERKR
jgi:sarcosine oxidase subunit beta